MPRQRKVVAAGIYQPLHERRAYGRRSSLPLVEDYARLMVTSGGVLHAASAPPGLARRVALRMPHGGVRWLLVCPGPHCGRRATLLYGVTFPRVHPVYQGTHYFCRHCLGLRYRSQYEGRRMEAHPDYLSQVSQRQITRTPRDVTLTPSRASSRLAAQGHSHRRRMARYDAVQDLLDVRQWRFCERRETAYTLGLMVLLAREVHRQHRDWARRILPAVLRDPNLDTRRRIAAARDTPAWARDAILASLPAQNSAANPATNTKPTPARRSARRSAHETSDIAEIVSEERIAEMRATYAALGQARRHKRAA